MDARAGSDRGNACRVRGEGGGGGARHRCSDDQRELLSDDLRAVCEDVKSKPARGVAERLGRAEKVADAAWPLVRANGGRAFVLCTTLRAVDKVAERLRQLMALDDQQLPLLVQGSSTRRALIDAFRSSGNAVLIGSISFWEGIDIRGDALSLVVIDKLPFAPPDDPVVEAKIRYLRKTGRNPFNEYQLPEAIMLMKQGVGRLVRDETDRGVLMILDERVLTKPYGKTVLASLPPFSRTRSEAEAVEFLTRRSVS